MCLTKLKRKINVNNESARGDDYQALEAVVLASGNNSDKYNVIWTLIMSNQLTIMIYEMVVSR